MPNDSTYIGPIPPATEDYFAAAGQPLDDDQWLPLDGFKSDEVALDKVRALIADHLGGIADDMDPHDVGAPNDLPAGIGALVSLGVNAQGDTVPFIFVRTDLPTDLRVDLFAFCAAVSGHHDAILGAPERLLAIGLHRQLVVGPGPGLLATLVARRLGRNTGSASFLTFTSDVLYPDLVSS